MGLFLLSNNINESRLYVGQRSLYIYRVAIFSTITSIRRLHLGMVDALYNENLAVSSGLFRHVGIEQDYTIFTAILEKLGTAFFHLLCLRLGKYIRSVILALNV